MRRDKKIAWLRAEKTEIESWAAKILAAKGKSLEVLIRKATTTNKDTRGFKALLNADEELLKELGMTDLVHRLRDHLAGRALDHACTYFNLYNFSDDLNGSQDENTYIQNLDQLFLQYLHPKQGGFPRLRIAMRSEQSPGYVKIKLPYELTDHEYNDLDNLISQIDEIGVPTNHQPGVLPEFSPEATRFLLTTVAEAAKLFKWEVELRLPPDTPN